MWKCPHCASEIDDDFSTCWNCGTSQDGQRTADFVRDTDPEELPADWVPRIPCAECGYINKVLLKHQDYRWWMLLLCFILFPAGLVGIFVLMLIGNYRYKTCPQCGNSKDLADTAEEPTAAAELTWQTANDADAEAFRQNKLRLLLGMLALLAILMSLFLYWNWHWLQQP